MTDPILLWLPVALCVIGIASLAAAAAVLRRRLQQPVIQVCAGPIGRLDFAASLDSDRFAEAAENGALEYVRRNLGERLADGTVITLQVLQQLVARSDMVVAASREATKALRAGAAVIQRHGPSGRQLPHVVDLKTGKALEVMKEVRFGRKALAGAAAASAIVVSAAHMISAADLARKLDRVDKKLDLLLAYRWIDQAAKLERVYTSARELLAEPLDAMRCMELWRLRGELRELRAAWRSEFEHHLQQIDDLKDRAWIDRMTTVRLWYDGRVSREISEGELRIAMIEYSLRLDVILAAASDASDVAGTTLAGELGAIERVGVLLKEKAGFISEERRGAALQMAERIEAVIAAYRALLPSRTEPVATEEIVSPRAMPLLAAP